MYMNDYDCRIFNVCRHPWAKSLKFMGSLQVSSGRWGSLEFGGFLKGNHPQMAMDQYLYIPFLGGWTSINPSYFDVNYRGTRFWHTAKWHMNIQQFRWVKYDNLPRTVGEFGGFNQLLVNSKWGSNHFWIWIIVGETIRIWKLMWLCLKMGEKNKIQWCVSCTFPVEPLHLGAPFSNTHGLSDWKSHMFLHGTSDLGQLRYDTTPIH